MFTITTLAECDAVVEATSEEMLGLWVRYAEGSNYTCKAGPAYPRLVWREQSAGFWREIGKCDSRPVCVGVSFATVQGRRIAFVEGVSQVVDRKMIREWTDTKKRDSKVVVTNAANFSHALRP